MFVFALSGLQDFLYDLSPETLSRQDRSRPTNENEVGGGRDRYAARRLRIRSALLTLVPATVAWELTQTDPKTEIIYLGGGKLIATGTSINPASEKKLLELYDWLVTASSGNLGAYWTITEDSSVTSGSISDALDALGDAKWRAGRHDAWHDLTQSIRDNHPLGQLGDRSWEATEGSNFGRREDIVGFDVNRGGWQVGPWTLRPTTSTPNIGIAGKNDASITVSIPTRAPKDLDGSVAELFKLAEEGQGAPYLALLKLDGDQIGRLMKNTLNAGTSEYRKTSAKLSEFFGRDLMERLARFHPRVYLVYSGGDDLVATGHYRAIIDCALDVQKWYANLQLGTVSAGIAIYQRNAPILKAVEAADVELEHAKVQRDAVSIGGFRQTWAELSQTVNEADQLVTAISNGSLNRGALQLLKQLGLPWQENAPYPISEKRWHSIPQMAYVKSRRKEWDVKRWPREVQDVFESLETNERDWPRAALLGTLAAWHTKERNKE